MAVLDTWGEFPKIAAIINNKKHYHTLREALQLWDSLSIEFTDPDEVLEADGTVRKMTKEEKAEFNTRLDDWSAMR